MCSLIRRCQMKCNWSRTWVSAKCSLYSRDATFNRTLNFWSYWCLPLSDIDHSFSVCSTENGEVRCKIEALKKVIQMILNGEKFQGLLMTVIRFVMPLQDHTIKKLLLVFWEVVPKYSQDGKMLQEMILVCDAYRKVPDITQYFTFIPKHLYFRYFVIKPMNWMYPCLISRTCNIPMSLFVAPLYDSCVN